MSTLINEPNRITPTSATVLDQFLVSNHLSITHISVGAPLETSDHCKITCQLEFSKKIQIKPFLDRFGITIKPTGKV